MGDANYMRYRRKRLMEIDPHCHWCKRPVFIYEKPADAGNRNWYIKDGKVVNKMPEDYATIDHLTSKFWGRRKEVGMKERTLVLACPKCNSQRSKDESQAHPWRQRWLSASLPYPFNWINPILRKARKLRKRINYWGGEWTRRNFLALSRRMIKWTLSWFMHVDEWCKNCGNETYGYVEPGWVRKTIAKCTGKQRRLCFGCLRGLCKKYNISQEWAVEQETSHSIPDKFMTV